MYGCQLQEGAGKGLRRCKPSVNLLAVTRDECKTTGHWRGQHMHRNVDKKEGMKGWGQRTQGQEPQLGRGVHPSR